jgi:hypothetical protein
LRADHPSASELIIAANLTAASKATIVEVARATAPTSAAAVSLRNISYSLKKVRRAAFRTALKSARAVECNAPRKAHPIYLKKFLSKFDSFSNLTD